MGHHTRLRIDLAYDGGPFFGFARQPDRRTVQGTLEAALASVLRQQVLTTCAGRTDRGVHALAQVVHLDADPVALAEPAVLDHPARLRDRIDRLVGPEITIWAARRVSHRFDARFSATSRRYRYRLVDGPVVDPLSRHDRWHLGRPLAVGPMREAAASLVGEHDFASFCRRAAGRTTVRRLDTVAISRPSAGRVDLRLDGAAFCHQQVRSIVGCLVEVGLGRREPGWVAQVLAARDRSSAARVSPPHGLTLERVGYGRGWPSAPPPIATATRG